MKERIQGKIIPFPPRLGNSQKTEKRAEKREEPRKRQPLSPSPSGSFGRTPRFSRGKEPGPPLPDFVCKMRNMASLMDEIDLLEKMVSETAYYIERMENHLRYQESLK